MMSHQSLLHHRIKINQAVSISIIIASVVSTALTQMPTISLSRYNIQDRPAAISLECDGVSAPSATFHQRLPNGTVNEVTNSVEEESLHLSFDLTIDREGVYYCMVNGVRSSNEHTLVASPLPDLALRSVRRYSYLQGDNATIHCSYPIGQLTEYYQIEWYKGLSKIQPGNQDFSRFEILGNFSLVVLNVEAGDDSSYYCGVRVLVSANTSVYVQSPSVRLEVVDRAQITQQLSDIAIATGGSAHFTCSASALPEPEITWLLKGAELSGSHDPVVDRSGEVATVTSSLILDGLSERDTGRVDCVAHHMRFGRVGMATTGANLIVLSNNFTVSLSAPQEGGALLTATLPAAIPGTFSLVVRYIYNPFTIRESELVSPDFKNTQSVSFAITEERLPDFEAFRVQVAVRANGVTGTFTTESNQINPAKKPAPVITTQECQCPDGATSDPSDPAYSGQTLLIVFIILVLVILTVAIVMTILCLYFFIRREPGVSGGGKGSYEVEEEEEEEGYDVDRKSGTSRSRSNSETSYSSSDATIHSGSYSDGPEEEEEVYSEIPSSLPTSARSTPLGKDRLPTEKEVLEFESRETNAANPTYVVRYKKRKAGRRSHDHGPRSRDHGRRSHDRGAKSHGEDFEPRVRSPDFSTVVPFTVA